MYISENSDLCFEWDPGKAPEMRKEYDFSEAGKNPYAGRLKKRVTIRIDEGTISYFKGLAQETGIPYQTLINLYLRDCAERKTQISVDWASPAKNHE